MAQDYYTLITTSGGAAIAAALAGGQPLTLTHLAAGESADSPSESMTALTSEKWRGEAAVSVDPENPGWVVVEATLPDDVGGWTLREVGVFAGDTLVAVGNYPETYLPNLPSGARKTVALKMVIEVATPGAVG